MIDSDKILAYMDILDSRHEAGELSDEEYEERKANVFREPTLEGSRQFDENRMLAYTANSLVRIQATLQVILKVQADLYARSMGGRRQEHYDRLSQEINDAMEAFHKLMFSQATETDEKINDAIEAKRKAKSLYEAKKTERVKKKS